MPGEALVPAPVLVRGRWGRLGVKYPCAIAAAVAASSRCVLRQWDASRLLGDGSVVEGIEVPGVEGAVGIWCSACSGPPWVSKWCCWAIRACIRCASLAWRFDSEAVYCGVAAYQVRRRRLARRVEAYVRRPCDARNQRRSRACQRVESASSLRTSGHLLSLDAGIHKDGHAYSVCHYSLGRRVRGYKDQGEVRSTKGVRKTWTIRVDPEAKEADKKGARERADVGAS